MLVSQKCLYALRAVFELAYRDAREPVKSDRIARAQGIPPRFLELILNQLKNAGYLASRRGKNGGYLLSASPRELTVAQIINAVQGQAMEKAEDTAQPSVRPRRGDYAFARMWETVEESIRSIYHTTTFADLMELEQESSGVPIANYVI